MSIRRTKPNDIMISTTLSNHDILGSVDSSREFIYLS
jgi:hypothetical protein